MPVKVVVSNPQNFDVIPENIVIPAFDTFTATIRFMPC